MLFKIKGLWCLVLLIASSYCLTLTASPIHLKTAKQPEYQFLKSADASVDKEMKLVWSDEFDYKGLPDSTKWSYDTQGNSGGWGNNELQYYTKGNIGNAEVKDGKLRITARKENVGDKKYSSARLITKFKGDWLYGRIEVNAKLPDGRGLWPAIWMLPTDWDMATGLQAGRLM